MSVRAASYIVACLLAAVIVAPAAAQPFGYPPGMSAAPDYDGVPLRRGAHVVRDQNGNEMVVNRRGRVLYYIEDGYPVRPQGRQYIRSAPRSYRDRDDIDVDVDVNLDDDNDSRPYFVDPGDRRVPRGAVVGVPGQQAGLPPDAQQSYQPPGYPPQILRQEQQSPSDQREMQESSLTPDAATTPGATKELPAQFRRQVVAYNGKEAAGTIIVDTRHTFLYLVLGNGQAMRYGIGVGREGFTWSGREKISRVAEWPDWYPPEEMIQRQPYLPRMMAGGPSNPLGARALYLGNTLYRIHGTNDPSTIGKYVSSGCIRLTNDDIEDLYRRVHVGTKVVVLPGDTHKTASSRR